MDHPLSFERLSGFIHALGRLHETADPVKALYQYIQSFPNPIPTDTGVVLFRLVFPHFTPRRRYHMKEKTLANFIARVMALNDTHASILRKWDDEGKMGQAACLGEEVQKVAQMRGLGRGPTSSSTLSLAKVDLLLDELACHSPFSDLGAERPKNPRSREAILYEIYSASGLSPMALSCITQIILQDLRPITCPLPAGHHHPSIALQLSASCKPPPPLDIFVAMTTWDWEMRDMYRVCGDLDAVCRKVQRLGGGAGRRRPGKGASRDPIVSVHVEIPKCEKGRSIESALKMIAGSNGYKTKEIWAETKYDGERMQIHVWIQNGTPCVKIYSKSKRDSTQDRKNTHSIILASLGFCKPPSGHVPQHQALLSKRLESIPYTGPPVNTVILEAEMLPYNESGRKGGKGPGIEEFWHLGGLSSRELDSAQDGSRHLYLSFFDILHLNGESLLNQSYDARRSCLQTVIRLIPGFVGCYQSTCVARGANCTWHLNKCQLAERTKVDITQGMPSAAAKLAAAFQQSSAKLEEGLVLKAAESTYNDRSLRWIKLKKDYIPGYGDCVDLAILAIGWDKDRARELRVGSSVMTTLYAGVLTNKAQVAQRKQDPHFEILFRVSYGLTKQQLAELNNSLGRPPFQTRKFDPSGVRHQGLSYRFTMRAGVPLPCSMLLNPINCELMGAGFQKIPFSKFHELRWPRIQKIYRPEQRAWVDALDADQYYAACLEALGYTESPQQVSVSPQGDSIARLFRTYSEGGIDLPEFWSPPVVSDLLIKKEDATLLSPNVPRTPVQRRSKSMVSWSPYNCSPGKSTTTLRRTTPLLTSMIICEEIRSVQKSCRTSSNHSSPRTPILRVSRRKRPPCSLVSTPRANVLETSDRPNRTCSASAFTLTGSLRELVNDCPTLKQDSRLVFVDGNDRKALMKIREEVARLRALEQRGQHNPIRLVDSRIFPGNELSDHIVEQYTLGII